MTMTLEEAHEAAAKSNPASYEEAKRWVALFGCVMIKALYVEPRGKKHLMRCPVCQVSILAGVANPFLSCNMIDHEKGCIYGEAIAHYARVSNGDDFLPTVRRVHQKRT